MTLDQYLQGQISLKAMNFPYSDDDLHTATYLINYYS